MRAFRFFCRLRADIFCQHYSILSFNPAFIQETGQQLSKKIFVKELNSDYVSCVYVWTNWIRSTLFLVYLVLVYTKSFLQEVLQPVDSGALGFFDRLLSELAVSLEEAHVKSVLYWQHCFQFIKPHIWCIYLLPSSLLNQKRWGFVCYKNMMPAKYIMAQFFQIMMFPKKNYGPILKNRSRKKCRIRAVSGPYQSRIRAVSGPYQGRIRAVSEPYQSRIRAVSGLKPWNLHFPLKTVCFVRGCLGMSQLFIWWWRRRMHLRQTLSKSKFQKVPVSDDRNYFHCTLLERLVSSNKELVLHWLFMFVLVKRLYSPPCVSKATNFLLDILK